MEYLNLIIFLVCFFSSIIQGLLGFGFGFLFMAIMPFYLPFKTVVAVCLILALFTIIRLFYPLRKYTKINVIFIPLLSFFIFTNIGVYFLMNFEGKGLTLSYAFLLILFALAKILNIGNLTINPSNKNAFIFGSIAGLIGGMYNIGGPFFAIYYLSVFDNMKEYYATIQLTFIFGAAFNIILHFLYGNIDFQILKYALSGFIAILMGSTLALKILDRINKEKLNLCVYIVLIIASTFLIFKEII